VFRSTDWGSTWNRVTVAPAIQIHSVDFLDDRIGIAAGYPGAVTATTDGGLTWRSVAGVGEPVALPSALCLSPTHWVVVNYGQVPAKVWVTRDAGVTWTISYPEIVDGTLSEDAQGRLWLAGYVLVNNQPQGVLVQSTDGGSTWRENFRTSSARPVVFTNVAFHQAGTGIVLSTYDYAAVSNNLGGEWHEVTSGVLSLKEASFISANEAFVINPLGLYRTVFDVDASVGSKRRDVDDISVEIYPNPARGQFTILVRGVQFGPVTARLYDALGREMFRATRTLAGRPILIDLSPTLITGTYFLTILTTDGGVAAIPLSVQH
jgi:hypothetical protein